MVFLVVLYLVSSIISDYILYVGIGGGLLIIVVTLAEAMVYEKFNEIDVGNTSVAIKKGMLSVKSIVIPYAKITDMNIHRSLLDRLLKLGLMEINTAGSEGMEVVFPDIRKDDLAYISKAFRENGAKYNDEK